jgi:hypothetical protein
MIALGQLAQDGFTAPSGLHEPTRPASRLCSRSVGQREQGKALHCQLVAQAGPSLPRARTLPNLTVP